MKKILTIFLMMSLMITPVLPVHIASAATVENDASMYVDLKGEWNFKLYRSYNRMFQYFPTSAGVTVTWEDLEAANLPSKDTWSSWEKITIPNDNPVTGGLLPTVRTDGSPFLPSWSEAWVSRSFELPSNFTTSETVTLLLGIIDDMDVVYINGHNVEASGFVDGNGKKTLNIPEKGGFDYKNQDPAAQVKFEKSYWQEEREYSIPANILKLGQTNDISIRLYNNNGYGGFYSGEPLAICGNNLAVRAVKGLPAKQVDSPELKAVVEKQMSAIKSGNIDLYAETVHDDYINNGVNKQGRMKELQAYFDRYSLIDVRDTNRGYYLDDEGNYWYSAKRTMVGTNKQTGTRETILDGKSIEISYMLNGDTMYERGNWSRIYPVTYDSKLFNRKLSYSLYLPPGYWENTDKKYPVVYLLHGINSTSSSFVNVDHIKEYMDQWIMDGSIQDMIVVMPDSGKNAFYKDTPYDPAKLDTTGPWQTHLTAELRNEIEAHYRTINDVKFRGITGISMGGFGAMTVGTSFPDLYSSVASHMGVLTTDALASLKSLPKEQLGKYDFYVDCGKQDTMVDCNGTVGVHEYLESMGIDHGYDLRDGGHNSAFYMAGMPYSMKMHSDHFISNGLLIENLIGEIKRWELNDGIESSLVQKLSQATHALTSGNQETTVNQLRALMNQVNAQRGKRLTNQQSDYLVREAQHTITVIEIK